MTAPTQALLGLLDSGPLGLLTHPNANAEALDCQAWLSRFLTAGHHVLVPEIAFYEVRRELRRTELKSGVPSRGLLNLDAFAVRTGVVPITSEVMVRASELWAQARHQRLQGAPDLALDGDMILCAQAQLLTPEDWNLAGASVMVITKNVKHLTHFVAAKHWHDA